MQEVPLKLAPGSEPSQEELMRMLKERIPDAAADAEGQDGDEHKQVWGGVTAGGWYCWQAHLPPCLLLALLLPVVGWCWQSGRECFSVLATMPQLFMCP